MQFCLTSGLLSTRSKVIKYKYVKNSNKIIEIMTRKSDENQLEPGKGIGLSPKFINWIFISSFSPTKNDLICMFMNINENIKMRTKPLNN